MMRISLCPGLARIVGCTSLSLSKSHEVDQKVLCHRDQNHHVVYLLAIVLHVMTLSYAFVIMNVTKEAKARIS